MDDHKKMTYTNFQIFLKISLAALIQAVIDSFETYTINSLMKKKIFETLKFNISISVTIWLIFPIFITDIFLSANSVKLVIFLW